MHGVTVYVKEGLHFAPELSLENSADSYLCFWLALLHSVSYFFSLYWSPSSSLCTIFDSISSNIDEVLLINPSANAFVIGDFNVHHKNWLSYSGGTVRPGELCYNLKPDYNSVTISNDLTQMVNFLLGSQTVILTVLLFWISFFLLTLVTLSSFAMAFPPLGNSDHDVVSVFIYFPSNSQWDALFYHIAYDYSRTDWDGLCDHLRDVPWEDL